MSFFPFRARPAAAGVLLVWAAAALSLPRAGAFDPAAGDFSRDNPNYVRVASYNCLQNFPAGSASENAAFNRILTAINPDVIAFQEIDAGVAASELEARLGALLGGSWEAWLGQTDGFSRVAICSRYALQLQRTDTIPASETRGVACVLANLPDDRFDADLYLMAVHFKCCGGAENDARRQTHADAIAKWLGDLRTPGGSINLAPNTPVVALGDFNLNEGFALQPHLTLMSGEIQNQATYGPAIKGDWDDSDLAEAMPADPFDLDADTWNSSGASPSGRLDRFYYTDSSAQVAQAFVLNARSMSAQALAAAGLQAADTETASDHLPVVADFAIAPFRATEPIRGQVFVTEFIANPMGSDANREWFEVFNASDAPADLNGWIIRDQGSNFHQIDAGGPLIIAPKGYLVFGREASLALNDGVALDYVYGDAIALNNSSGDTLELYRGGVKVDGIRFNGGPEGVSWSNANWGGAPVSARSRGMTGNYQNGPTTTFAEASTVYGVDGEYGSLVNRGTPGALNDEAVAPASTPAGWTIR